MIRIVCDVEGRVEVRIGTHRPAKGRLRRLLHLVNELGQEQNREQAPGVASLSAAGQDGGSRGRLRGLPVDVRRYSMLYLSSTRLQVCRRR